MRILAAVLLLICLLPPPVWAGAWPREKGTGFSAISSTLRRAGPDQPLRYDTSTYLEYGLTHRFTLGLDINDDLATSGHVLVFGRVPLSPPDARIKLAFLVGIGGHRQFDLWQPMYKVGLSMGRDVHTRWGQGWIAVDAAAELRQGTGQSIFKLDGTFGVTLSPKWKAMVQLESYYAANAPFGITLTPSVVFALPENNALVLGLEFKHNTQRSIGLKAGFWKSF
jgi:hypothetical protein